MAINCSWVPQASDQDYLWRRIQVSQVQAERQKKSILQLAMVFHSRAEKIVQDLVLLILTGGPSVEQS